MADRKHSIDDDDRAGQVDDPALVAAARHALHDEELVASFAVDGENAEDAAKARSLIERCPTCRELHADVVAIGSSIRAVGTAAATAADRAAPRDFRLTPMDAARLQQGNVVRRVAARVLAGAAMFGRPVGMGLAALGVVGLVVGSIGLGQLSSGVAPQSEGAGAAVAATEAPAPSTTFDRSNSQPGASAGVDQSYAGPATTTVPAKEPTGAAADSGTGGGPMSQLFVAASILLLVIGLAVFLLGLRHARAWGRQRQRT